jgi:UDP-N-acetylmuramyl pentapeptide phosphotransferase/UDP-N-acetylglucosamine-1-phosphate transferase
MKTAFILIMMVLGALIFSQASNASILTEVIPKDGNVLEALPEILGIFVIVYIWAYRYIHNLTDGLDD